MTRRIEYVSPHAVEFVNELDLAEREAVEDPHDRDLLVLHYDEIVAIPGDADTQLALWAHIAATVQNSADAGGRALRPAQPTARSEALAEIIAELDRTDEQSVGGESPSLRDYLADVARRAAFIIDNSQEDK